jgi:hypothetical protein
VPVATPYVNVAKVTVAVSVIQGYGPNESIPLFKAKEEVDQIESKPDILLDIFTEILPLKQRCTPFLSNKQHTLFKVDEYTLRRVDVILQNYS